MSGKEDAKAQANGREIVRLRQLKGWTRKGFAEIAGIAYKTATKAERSDWMRVNVLRDIADTLRVEPKDIMIQAGSGLTEMDRVGHHCQEAFPDVPLPAQDAGEILVRYTQALQDEIEKGTRFLLDLTDATHCHDILVTPLVYPFHSRRDPPLSLDASSLLESSRSAVLGAPGSGKTMVLRKLALDLLGEVPPRYVPVYVDLGPFVRFCDQDSEYPGFDEYLDACLSKLGCSSLELLATIADAGLVLLLDGWEDLTDDGAMDRVKTYLNRSEYRFVLTCRTEREHTLPWCENFGVCPVSRDRVSEFARLRIEDPARIDEFERWVSGSARLCLLAANPLNLSLMAVAFSKDDRIGHLHKTQLYERAFEILLRSHHKLRNQKTDLSSEFANHPLVDSALQFLAFDMIQQGDRRFFTQRQLLSAIQRASGNVSERLHQFLSKGSGIIREHSGGLFEFFHTWYTDFLAARHMVADRKALASRFNDARFSDSLPFVVGLLPSANAVSLLDRVTSHSALSFGRALSEVTCDPSTMLGLVRKLITSGEDHLPELPATAGMARILSEAGPDVRDALYTIARDAEASCYLRRAALEAIALLSPGERAFARLLLDLLDTATGALLWHVVEHIGAMDLCDTEREGVIRELRTFEGSSDPILAGDAISALRHMGIKGLSRVPRGVRQGLLECLKSEDSHVQGHALKALGTLRIQEALPQLRSLLDDKDVLYRFIVPLAAIRIGGKGAVGLLERALDHKDEWVVARTLEELCELDEPMSQGIMTRVERLQSDRRCIESLDVGIADLAKAALRKIRYKELSTHPATIWVARHCLTEWNLEERIQGKEDIPLCEEGRREAEANIEHLKQLGIQRIVTSNYRRALETAQIYASALQVRLCETPAVRELDHGTWEGKKREQLLRDESSRFGQWLQDPGGYRIPGGKETVARAQQRIIEAIEGIARSSLDQTVLVISHKHILGLLMCRINKVYLTRFVSMTWKDSKPRRLDAKAVADLCR